MAEAQSETSIARLVAIPALITLAVTILRLVGELQHWPSSLFSAAPGGGGAIIGIVWLAPIFGVYFAAKLIRQGAGPASALKAFGCVLLGMVVLVGGLYLSFTAQFKDPARGFGGTALIALAGLIPLLGWSRLGKTLLAYGYAARIPVAFIMFFAIRGNWGTHYDGAPPGFPSMGFWPKYIYIGLIPQLIGWVAFTIILGSLFGVITAALTGRKKVEAAAGA